MAQCLAVCEKSAEARNTEGVSEGMALAGCQAQTVTDPSVAKDGMKTSQKDDAVQVPEEGEHPTAILGEPELQIPETISILYVGADGLDSMNPQQTLPREECELALSDDFVEGSLFEQGSEKDFVSLDGLEGFCLPEDFVTSHDYVSCPLRNQARQFLEVCQLRWLNARAKHNEPFDILPVDALVVQMGLALIRVAAREIRKELGFSRLLTRAQAQMEEGWVDLLCKPKEPHLADTEEALWSAWREADPLVDQRQSGARQESTSARLRTLLWLLSREGNQRREEMVNVHVSAWNLTPSETAYVNHRFYEFVADYHFAVTMHEFLYGAWPLEPRKSMPGEAALASPYVIRILSGLNRCLEGEAAKRSLLNFQLQHIEFRRQLPAGETNTSFKPVHDCTVQQLQLPPSGPQPSKQ
ncbi:hypothetical protein Efla_005811 [Eimeria flavescens]